MSATTTPRTDAAERTIESFDPSDTAVNCYVARQLETELTAKTAELDVWRKCDRIMDGYPPATSEPHYVQLERMIKLIDELKSQLRETRAAALEEAADHCLKTCDYSQSGVEFTGTRRLLAEQLHAKAASVREGGK